MYPGCALGVSEWVGDKALEVLEQPRGPECARGKPFLQYYLEQMQGFNQRHRLRLVDIVDVHAYVTQITDATDSASQVRHPSGRHVLCAARLRKTLQYML